MDDLTLEKLRVSERLVAVETILKTNQENLIAILQTHSADIKDLKHTVYGHDDSEGLRETVRGISKREKQRAAYVHTGVITAMGLFIKECWQAFIK